VLDVVTACTAVAIVAVAVSDACDACATSVIAVAIAVFTACCAGLTTTCSEGAGGSLALAKLGLKRKSQPTINRLVKKY
jgi:predicted lysophospholipase L1 biosynthesis ABC-type transport system permease subunit